MTTTTTPSRYSPEAIIVGAAMFFHKRLEEVRGQTRHKSTMVPRHVAMYLMRKHTDLTLEEIGFHFDNRDHSTVHHAMRSVEKLLTDKGSVLGLQITEIESRLDRSTNLKNNTPADVPTGNTQTL